MPLPVSSGAAERESERAQTSECRDRDVSRESRSSKLNNKYYLLIDKCEVIELSIFVTDEIDIVSHAKCTGCQV